MIRNFIFLSVALVSANAFAGAADLVGRWQAGCYPVDSAGSIYSSTFTEFRDDGSAQAANHFYADATCTSQVTITDPVDVNYTATETTIRILGTAHGINFEYAYTYLIKDDILTMVVTEALVDGKPQEGYAGESAQLRRVK